MRIIKSFPDPFLTKEGKRVKSIENWEKRRSEITELMQNIQYGTIPEAPDEVKATIEEKITFDTGEIIENVHFDIIPDKTRSEVHFGMDGNVLIPPKEAIKEKKKKIPNFGKKKLPCLIYVGGNMLYDMSEEGYVVISYQNTQLEPDKMGNPIIGPAQEAYNRLFPNKYTWGSIAVWAWGAMRMVDYALSRSEINPDQVMISGHSRNGKTALLAGALDERISIVNPAGSGCAGAGSYLALGEHSEDLKAITDHKRWWAWLHPDFERFAGKEETLPFDQHYLMGLVAPRPLLRVEGKQDAWANPKGTSCSFLATQPIYDLLDAAEWNGIFYHNGGHKHTDEDREALREFAESYFFKAEKKRSFKEIVVNPSIKLKIMDWD
ncbi:MAG: hypothetical protein GF364_03610 [Candidatus Lokiarchaeota archaeon]|nr:hypothetical protein [Candidatus Lokiarchaeota archaeon]